MRQFARLISRFGADERGMFAVIFGLMAIVLVATAGAVVDFVTLQQARNRAQIALDAAALALQPRIFETGYDEEEIRQQAQALVIERIADDRITAAVDVIDTDPAEGSLYLEAFLQVPTYFVELVGVPQLSARMASEATRKRLDLEVAMVLDNSGSMASYNRMTYLKQAAECATNILFYETVNADCAVVGAPEAKDNVKIGIVPFTIMVNIGTQFADKDWLDWSGESLVSKLNFDDDDDENTPFVGQVDRRDLFEQTGTSWRGCVEARQAPYDTTDAKPDTPERLFVPMFVPDTADGLAQDYLPDTGGSCEQQTCTQRRVYKECSYSWRGWTCTGQTGVSYIKTIGSTTSTSSASCITSNASLISGPTLYRSGSSYVEETVYDILNLSTRERQERLCKYDRTRAPDTSSRGPNANCPEVTILPLTDVPLSVFDKIDDMRAGGNTNIQQGAAWGMHMLTPNEPLTEALNRDSNSVSKVMIVMTDGFNEPDFQSYWRNWNGTNQYFSWGFRKDGRLADTDGILGNEGEYSAFNDKADMTAAMDQKLIATCASAKASGITVYTIGLSSPSEQATQTLRACASSPDKARFPTTPTQLVGTFRAIAEELAQLRLAL